MSDAEFDTMLRSALLEAVRQDWAHILENDHLPEPQFSSRFLRWERKVLADPFGYARPEPVPSGKGPCGRRPAFSCAPESPSAA